MSRSGCARAEIFLCYAAVDGAFAQALAQVLEASGAGVYHHQCVLPGDSVVGKADEALARCSRMVVLVSPSSMADPWVERHWQSFVHRTTDERIERPLVPVLLRAAPQPELLSGLRPVKLSSSGGARELLRDAAAAALGRQEVSLDGVEVPALVAGPGVLWSDACALLSEVLRTTRQRRSYDPRIAGIATPALAANALLVLRGAERGGAAFRDALADADEELRELSRDAVDALYDRLAEHERVADEAAAAPLRTWLTTALGLAETAPLAHAPPGSEGCALDRMYVELHAGRRSDPERCRDDVASLGRDASTVPELLARRPGGRFCILGEPGSGKTTLLTRLTELRAREFLRGAEPGQGAIPLYARLGELAEVGVDPFAFVDHPSLGLSPGTGAMLLAEARAGRVLLLLDGLDEVRPESRERALALIRTLAARADIAACPILVTSRTFGYTALGGRYEELALQALGESAQRELLQRWFGEPDGAAKATRVLEVIAPSEGLRHLAKNPYHLTLIAELADSRLAEDLTTSIDVPHRRAALLREAVDHRLRNGTRRRRTGDEGLKVDGLHHVLKVDDLRPVLEDAALALLRRHSGPYQREEICDALAGSPAWTRFERLWPGAHPGSILDTVAEKIGLLGTRPGPRERWEFHHRSMQEHLAAASLARAREATWGPLADEVAQRAKQEGAEDPEGSELGRWAETFALLAEEIALEEAERYGRRARKREAADRYLLRLRELSPDLALHALGALGDGVASADTIAQLVELVPGGRAWPKRMEAILSIPERLGMSARAVGLLERILGGTTHGADLYFVQQALERLAGSARTPDARRRAEDALLPERLFAHPDRSAPPELEDLAVRTPDGDARPYWCPVPLPGAAFRMAVVPVTNALYERFDPGHRADRAFVDRSVAGDLADHPVVDVTWYEAVSFCRWLALRYPGARLPTVVEWEHAATGGDGRVYPWGDDNPTPELAHFDQSWETGSTLPVGRKPAGVGPFGTLEQAGNVWEWCSGEEGSSEPPKDPREERPLRGGSWDVPAESLRAACRVRLRARLRLRYIGFRCVWPSPAEHGP